MKNYLYPAAECGLLPAKGIKVQLGDTAAVVPGYGETSEVNALVPRVNPDYQWHPRVARLLVTAMLDAWETTPGEERYGLHLQGPPGTGKTTSVLQFCAALGTPCVSVEADVELDIKSLMVDARVENGTLDKRYGVLRQAMEGGYPFVLNEWDNAQPGLLTKIFGILDNGTYVADDGEVVVAKRGFLLVLTSNAGGNGDLTGYTSGARRQSEALKRRVKGLYLDYASMGEEEDYLRKRLGLPAKVVRPFVKVAEQTRQQYRAGLTGQIGAGATVPLNAAITRQQLAAWLKQGRRYLQLALDQDATSVQAVTPWIEALEETYGHALLPEQWAAVSTTAANGIHAIAEELLTQLQKARASTQTQDVDVARAQAA